MQNLEFPPTLYKYRSFENKDPRALFDFELFASSRKHFNDPFDNAMPYKYSSESFTLEKFIKKYISLYDHNKRGKKTIVELIQKATERFKYIIEDPERHWRENASTILKMDEEFYGIISMSNKPKNILMWSHYAKYHTGFCLGLNGKELAKFMFSSYQEFGLKIGPVNYSSSYPLLDFEDDHNKAKSFGLTFTKHNCWSYEDEYRIVLNKKSNEVIKYPNEIISEIYLGCRISVENKEKVLKFIQSQNLKIKIYELKMGFEKFDLNETLLYDLT